MMIKRVAVTLCLICAGSFAQASDYLGFDLGTVTKEKVAEQLKSARAIFEDNYGYKGYSSDLTLFKVSSYDRFNKFGRVNEAWLGFNPKGQLYNITVTYSDAGEVFKILKDALEAKYGRASQQGSGFEFRYKFQDGRTDIYLLRNTFGFGEDQKTTLEYIWTPFTNDVTKMKQAIDDHIRKQNAKKASGDL
jgi:hypothetical protein